MKYNKDNYTTRPATNAIPTFEEMLELIKLDTKITKIVEGVKNND